MKYLLIVVMLASIQGCATKSYGRQVAVTQMERTELTCRELLIETERTKEFIAQTERASKFSFLDVLAIAGDFGIGNAIEKRSALRSANNRLEQLNKEIEFKKCLPAW